jgi:hypothetical protein
LGTESDQEVWNWVDLGLSIPSASFTHEETEIQKMPWFWIQNPDFSEESMSSICPQALALAYLFLLFFVYTGI